MRTATLTCITLLFLLTAFLSSAAFASAEETTCPIGITTGLQTWDQRIYGDAPYLCLGESNNCRYRLDYTSICANDGSYECHGSFVSTGDQCTESEGQGGNMMWPGGNVAVEPEEPEEPEQPGGGDGTDPTDPDTGDSGGPDDDLEPPVDYNGWACWNQFDGSSRCVGGISMLDYSGNFEQIYDRIQLVRDDVAESRDYLTFMNNNVDDVESSVQNVTSSVSALNSNLFDVSRDIESINDRLDNLDVDVDLSGIEDKISSLQGMSQYYFNALMENTSGLMGQFGGVNGRIDQTNGYLNQLDGTMRGNFSGVNAGISQNNAAINRLSGDIDALANQIADGTGESGDGESDDGENIDMSGVESRLDGIQSTLDGNGLSGRAFEGKVDFDSNSLYSDGALEELQAEIEKLEEQYEKQMGEFRSLFSFDASELDSGEYVEHEWRFTFLNGQSSTFSSGVFPALLDTSGLIAAILLFLAVLAGIKALAD